MKLLLIVIIAISLTEINSFRHKRWPKNKDGKVVVSFEINGFASPEESKIRLAFEEVNKFTCVLFTDRNNETDYVDVFSGDDCGAQIGRLGGRQEFSLGNRWCPVQHGMILHDLLHVLGLEHMHQHPKRDDFVNIYWENIIEGVEPLYARIDDERFENFNTPYDYESVMHFGNVTFSKNKKKTLEALDDDFKDKIGQRKALSEGDVKRINRMYSCA